VAVGADVDDGIGEVLALPILEPVVHAFPDTTDEGATARGL
jgi:hypothetical protein